MSPAALRLGGAVLITALASGCALLTSVREMAEQEAAFRNDLARQNLRSVSLALSMYARDHRGLYPPDATWLPELSRSYYLPNQRLPINPWSLMGEWGQANVPTLGPLPAIEGPDHPAPPTGTVLGKGIRPHSPTYTFTTYGAVLYDASPDRRLCVLYGVGQQGEEAILLDSYIRGNR